MDIRTISSQLENRAEMSGKNRHDLVIPDDIWKKLKIFIVNKQGDFKKGDLSKWVVIAIRNLIREERQHHQHSAYNLDAMSKEEEMTSTLSELMKDISRYFWKLETPFPFRVGIDIHKKTLKTAISVMKGRDQRTIKKWEQRLVEFGFLRKSSNNQYKILNDGHESYDTKQESKEEFENVIKGF